MRETCPICNSANIYKVYKTINVCESCNFCFEQNISEQCSYDDYYRSAAAHSNKHQADSQKTAHQVKVDYICKALESKDVSVLDVGCATGGILKELDKRGFTNLHGIEISNKCVEVFSQSPHITVSCQNIFTVDYKIKYDLVILSDIMEHLVDIRLAVRCVSKLLKSNGFVFVSVPDTARFAGSSEVPLIQFSHEHINYFSLHALSKLFAQEGMYLQFANICDLYIGGQQKEPNIFAIFQSSRLGTQVVDYVDSSQRELEQIVKKIEGELLPDEKAILWGAGTLSKILLSVFPKDRILYLVDANKDHIGKTVYGLPVKSESEAEKGVPIIVCSKIYKKEIGKKAKKLSDEVIFAI